MNRDTGLILTIVGAALLLTALLTPWWTVEGEFSSDGGGMFGGMGGMSSSGDSSAGPFDDGGGLIEDGQATLTGLLVLLGLLATLMAATFLLLARTGGQDQLASLAPWFTLGAVFLVFLAVLLAPLTWPGDDAGFWDSASSSGSGFTSSFKSFASVGWYLGITGALVSIAAAAVVLNPGTQDTDAPEAETA